MTVYASSWRLWVVVILLLVVVLLSRVDKLTENVYTLHLVADCYLDYHVSIQAVGLACPGVDYMRLWSLSARQPWEEPTDRPAGSGWYARRIDPQAEVG